MLSNENLWTDAYSFRLSVRTRSEVSRIPGDRGYLLRVTCVRWSLQAMPA